MVKSTMSLGGILSLSFLMSWIALEGQVETQFPHPIHLSKSTEALPSVIVHASMLHRSIQVSQTSHSSSLTAAK